MMTGFTIGAVAAIDALGWKGIWRRREADQTLRTLDQIQECAEASAKAITRAGLRLLYGSPWPESVEIQARFFSDTIVIAATVDPPESAEDVVLLDRPCAPEALPEVREVVLDALLDIVCQRVAEVICVGAVADPPLLYRGAVAVGSVLIDGTRFLGEAIDRAAGAMDAPNAAVVWIPPSTQHLPNDFVSGVYTVESPIPVRGRNLQVTTVRAQAVNPFLMCKNEPMVSQVEAGFIRGFCDDPSRDLDVVVKYQETMAFLQTAKASWEELSTGEMLPRSTEDLVQVREP